MSLVRYLSFALVPLGVLVCNVAALAQTRLNNFVTEFCDITASASQTCEFTFADPGWVFIRTIAGNESVYVTLDQSQNRVIEYAAGSPPNQETMRYLKAGSHTATVRGGKVARFQVRRVPEIRYCSYQYDPWVYQEGAFDWAFLQKYILPHVNTIVGFRDEDHRGLAESWRSRGGRWIAEVAAPGLDRNNPNPPQLAPTPADIISSLTANGKLDRSWLDGFLVDEYYPSLEHLFQPTLEAVHTIHGNARFAGKRIDLYVAGNADRLGDFVSRAIDERSLVALESYHAEQPTESDAKTFLQQHFAERMAGFNRVRPNAARSMVVALGIFSTPPETLDVYPFVNERVFRDMEFELLANDPAFNGLAGVMAYTSGYASEQSLRWTGKLYRHYCIEGRSTRLGNEPYLLTHLRNSDFQSGTDDWQLHPAAANSITARSVAHLGEWQGRYNAPGVGNQCLIMTRSEKGPNQVQQTIRDLQPGKVYTLTMYSTDLNQGRAIYGNPTFDDVAGIRITIENTEPIANGCYDHLYRSIHHDKPMFLNYHVRRFRATAVTAELKITDWHDSEKRGGNVGRETAVNFVEVRPYLSNEQDE